MYAANGYSEEAEDILSELKGRARDEYIDAVWPASIHALLGERDEAFEWLDRGVDERSALANGAVRSLPAWAFEGLHDDARFQDLARRVPEGE